MPLGRKPSGTPRVPTHARGVATAEAIVQAVSKIVSESGVRGVTIRAVAETAGVGMGSLYQFFPTRDALIVAWEEQFLLNEIAPMATRLAEVSLSFQDLRSIVQMFVREAMRVFERIVAAHGPGAEDELLARFAVREQLSNRFEELLTSAFEHTVPGTIRPKRYRAAARLVMRSVCYISLDHALVRRMNAGQGAVVDDEEYMEELIDMVHRYLSDDPPASPPR
jgi:AcrR family transcriptional regulator